MSNGFPVPMPPRPAPQTDSGEPNTGEPNLTGLDDLVRGLDDLADRPVSEHHDRLAEVHETLHAALHEPAAHGAVGGRGSLSGAP